jgi:hypothetical protein
MTRRRLLTLAALAGVAAAVVLVVTLASPGGPRVGSGPRLAWAPPELHAPQTVRASPGSRTLRLDPTRDYRVKLPDGRLTGPGGLTIVGGRNVVLIGGTIDVALEGAAPSVSARRGLLLKDQTGTMHVEGLLIRGPDLSEGIDLDQRQGGVVQLQNVRVEGVHARDQKGFTDNHPDVVQSYAGPAELRIDRLTGDTDYQGLFLNPREFSSRLPRRFDLRHLQIAGGPTSQYLLWQAEPFPLAIRDVWLRPARGRSVAQALWPDPTAWRGVRVGTPPGGDFVPADVPGADYASPGYTG